MARLIREKKDTWRIVVEAGVDPITLKRKRIVRTFLGSQKEAERERARLELEALQPPVVEPSKQPLGEYLIRWIDTIARPELKPVTYQGYRWYIVKHINPIMGHIPLSHLVPLHIQEFCSYKIENGRLDGKGPLSNRSVIYIHSILRQALERAVDLELIPKNPCARAKPPRSRKRRGKTGKGRSYVVLDAEQLTEFLDRCQGHRDYALVHTAAYTGMRQSELLGLQWHHILWNENAIDVEQALSLLEGGKRVLGETKNLTSTRTVKVTDSVMAILREHKKAQLERQLKSGGTFVNHHNMVFPDIRNGEFENRKNLSHRFSKLAKRAGYEGFRFHDLRHTHATILLSAGEYINAVSERLGHADVDTTLRTYGHVLPKKQDEVAKRFAFPASREGLRP